MPASFNAPSEMRQSPSVVGIATPSAMRPARMPDTFPQVFWPVALVAASVVGSTQSASNPTQMKHKHKELTASQLQERIEGPWHCALVFNRQDQATYSIVDSHGSTLAMFGGNWVVRDFVAKALIKEGVKFSRPVSKVAGDKFDHYSMKAPRRRRQIPRLG